jgi:hypothetical protein
MANGDKDKKRFGRDTKLKAKTAVQNRQARFASMCKDFKKANPTAKRCKLTDAQKKELDGMVTDVQGAIDRQGKEAYKLNRPKDKAIIQGAGFNKK